MLRALWLSVFAVCISAVQPTIASADVIFTDGTFKLTNYTQTSLYSSDGKASVTLSHCNNCGDPDKGLKAVVKLPRSNKATETTALGLINNGFVFDPGTDGTVHSIDVSADHIDTINTAVGGDLLTALIVLIEQDGNFYDAIIFGPSIPAGQTTSGYNLYSGLGLTAADFTQFDFGTGVFGTAHPDFAGDPLSFGIMEYFSTGCDGCTKLRITAAWDNLTIRVNGVPEPSSLMDILSGLMVLGTFSAFSKRGVRPARIR